MLFAVLPSALVYSAVGPLVYAEPMLFVKLKLAFEPPTIGPGVNAAVVHLIIDPFAFVFLVSKSILCHRANCIFQSR